MSDAGRYRVKTKEQWQKIIEEFQADNSGLTAKAFCEQRGLVLSTYYKWKKHYLEKDIARLNKNQLIELVPPPAPVADWDVELELGNGMMLRLRKH